MHLTYVRIEIVQVVNAAVKWGSALGGCTDRAREPRLDSERVDTVTAHHSGAGSDEDDNQQQRFGESTSRTTKMICSNIQNDFVGIFCSAGI